MQARFAEEYIVDLCAVRAAERAGYKDPDIAWRLIGLSHVQRAIERQKAARAKRTHITQDRVLQEVARLAFFDPRKLYDEHGNLKPVHELDDDTAAAIASVEVVTTYKRGADGEMEPEQTKKVRMWDKNNALEKAGKHLKLWSGDDAGNGGGTVNVVIQKFVNVNNNPAK